MAVRSPQDTYARHVSSAGGYPLWSPEPSSQLLSYRPEGLRIGDVGVVVPENGNFDIFFNICLPKDHRLHRAYGVPDGFEHIQLNDADIRTVLNVEGPGRIITTPAVTRLENGATPAARDTPLRPGRSDVSTHMFNLSSTEGGILILPEGADRHDVRDPRPFFEQASRHAATWYRFAEEKLGRIISHDSIYIVTGFHKARSWSVATYQNERGDGDFLARLTMRAREGQGLAAGYHWEATRNMDWRVGPIESLGIPNQSVFIRGFKIALRSAVQGVPQKWVHFQPSHPSGRCIRKRSSGSLWISNMLRSISKTLGMQSEKGNHSAKSDPREDGGLCVEIQRIPEILPVFHPSDVINQYILQKEPSARVAITHDRIWGLLLDENLLKRDALVQNDLLINAVSERYTTTSREGVAYLQSKSGFGAVDAPDHSPTLEDVQFSTPESLTIVSESNLRCIDITLLHLSTKHRRTADLHSIPSKFAGLLGVPSLESLRPIKIIVISDYICGFCYICEKILQEAIDACRDLPLRFDVEFRPFTLVNSSNFPAVSLNQPVYRNAYVAGKYGKEKGDLKMKVMKDYAQKAGLYFAEDSVVCITTQAHRLSVKAYREGGSTLQSKFNEFMFDACFSKWANISDEDVLVNASVTTGVMGKEETRQFLQSNEYLDCVEKMLEAARFQGISGVPFVIIDGKWAVNGLQPKDCFIQIFRKLAHLPTSLVVAEKTKT